MINQSNDVLYHIPIFVRKAFDILNALRPLSKFQVYDTLFLL
jgi:hypothetical protein